MQRLTLTGLNPDITNVAVAANGANFAITVYTNLELVSGTKGYDQERVARMQETAVTYFKAKGGLAEEGDSIAFVNGEIVAD
jgi:hypothetical protein